MKKIIVGVSGASGIALAKTLLEELSKQKVQIHLIQTQSAKLNAKYENIDNLEQYATFTYDNAQLDAPISSGSFRTEGMIVIPCSMKSLASIKNGLSDNLISRSADVCIKEKRPLILVPRETPLNPIHLENMLYLSKLEKLSIIPPMLSYYHHPKNLHDIELQLVGKILSFFDIQIDGFKQWKS